MEARHVRPATDVARAVLEDLPDRMRGAAAERGRVVLCLSGGSTPLPLYRALAARDDLPWSRTWIAWGDERMVDPDHEDRNERAAREALLNRVPIPEEQVLAWPFAPNADASLCAETYERRLRAALGDPEVDGWFDVVLLGLGADAHTAGLFPGTGGTRAPGHATVTRPASQPTERLTLTPRGLSSTRAAWFLVSGASKRAALRATLEGEDAERTPAIAIRPREELRVYTDVAP